MSQEREREGGSERGTFVCKRVRWGSSSLVLPMRISRFRREASDFVVREGKESEMKENVRKGGEEGKEGKYNNAYVADPKN